MYNAESALEPVGTTLHQPPAAAAAAAADSPPLLLLPCHNTARTGPRRCWRTRRLNTEEREAETSRSRAPSSHLNISSRACRKLRASTRTFVRGGRTPGTKAPARVCTHAYAGTYTRERGARMNTQRTGVPGAGLFSEQSDIYRKGKEGEGGGGGGWKGRRRRRRSVLIPAVLTN